MTGGGRTNTWDGQNRLTQCVFGGTTTTHTYGSDGLRRRTVEGTNTTDYVLDGQSVVRTFLNASVDRTYLHGLRGPEYERIGTNDPVWNLYDGLGSVLGTVDKNGTVVSTRKYDVYGAVRGSTGPGGTKHKFVGNLGHPSEDDTGLVYMRARYYDPVTGRFASEDPAGDGINWYSYCSNNPASRVDPSGKSSVLAAAGIGAVLGFALGFVGGLLGGKTVSEAFLSGIAGAIGGAVGGAIGGCIGAAAGVLVGSIADDLLHNREPNWGKAGFAALFAFGFAGAAQLFAGCARGGLSGDDVKSDLDFFNDMLGILVGNIGGSVSGFINE